LETNIIFGSSTTPPVEKKPILEIKGVSKAFGHVQALDQVDLELFAGEILALVGDNGAGKSTLIKILAGVYRPDSCQITIDGQCVDIRDPSDAQGFGIATVYQDLALVDTRNVAANVYLGCEPTKAGFLIDYRKMQLDAEAVLSTLRIDIPSILVNVGELSGGQRQAVAIARALARGRRIFILDEPTAALGVEQSAKVTSLIEDLKTKGMAILMVSHNLEHVFQIADRLIILRHGKRVGSRLKEETSREEIVGLITGAIHGDVN
jgi:ABC-type sugar transport system ATPase subunit